MVRSRWYKALVWLVVFQLVFYQSLYPLAVAADDAVTAPSVSASETTVQEDAVDEEPVKEETSDTKEEPRDEQEDEVAPKKDDEHPVEEKKIAQEVVDDSDTKAKVASADADVKDAGDLNVITENVSDISDDAAAAVNMGTNEAIQNPSVGETTEVSFEGAPVDALQTEVLTEGSANAVVGSLPVEGDVASDGQAATEQGVAEDCVSAEGCLTNVAAIENVTQSSLDTGGNVANGNGVVETAQGGQTTGPVGDEAIGSETVPETDASAIASENDQASVADDNMVVADSLPSEDIVIAGGDGSVIEEVPSTEVALLDDAPAQVSTDLSGALADTPMLADTLTEISTGNADASVDVVNDVNSVALGDNVQQFIINLYGNTDENINLLRIFLALLQNAGAVQTTSSSVSTDTTIVNDASVETTAVSSADTGNNQANGNGSDASISTGDATAQANVVNIVNRVLVGDNWLFVIINIFGDWTGDLIVPGEGLIQVADNGSQLPSDVVVENSADVENTATATADTGHNSASDNGGLAGVAIGDAIAVTDTVTVANTTLTDADNQFILTVNPMGIWTGDVLNWLHEVTGLTFEYTFGTEGGSSGEDPQECVSGCGTAATLFIKNIAKVVNTATAIASTGNNQADGNAGDASIETGDAFARTNIFNLVNTTLVGNNWLFVLVNIFGTWRGNVEFAYPDVQVGLDDGRSDVSAGDRLTYVVSYANDGQADAKNVSVNLSLPSDVAYAGGAAHVSGNELFWTIPEVPVGGTGTFSVEATVNGNLTEDRLLAGSASIATETTEVERGNNTASDTTMAHRPVPVNVAIDAALVVTEDVPEFDSTLKISHKNDADRAVKPGDIVTYSILVENTGEMPVGGIEVRDLLKNVNGQKIALYTWNVGGLYPDEKVLIEYSMQVHPQAVAGTYESSASAVGYDPFDDKVKTKKVSSLMNIFVPVAVAASPQQVEGVSDQDDELQVIPMPQQTVDTRKTFPLWMLLLSFAAYALLINWAFFPKRRRMYGTVAVDSDMHLEGSDPVSVKKAWR